MVLTHLEIQQVRSRWHGKNVLWGSSLGKQFAFIVSLLGEVDSTPVDIKFPLHPWDSQPPEDHPAEQVNQNVIVA
jgi:hypothetical protein